ncbi:hypothetical protein [Rhizobium sp. BK176]|uniref:hypothetical protein n=1 Tax=Rhizobium sp. BK176 TaxID=2587071 RepID=UPI00216A18FE|nr:hypothetical protein [Rhizobium sp. BK176]MCS4089181.1 hypothetical protein [Rhizobium sp. BK176]
MIPKASNRSEIEKSADEHHPFHSFAATLAIGATLAAGLRLVSHLTGGTVDLPTVAALGTATVGSAVAAVAFGNKLQGLVEESKRDGTGVDMKTLHETPRMDVLARARAAIAADKAVAADEAQMLANHLNPQLATSGPKLRLAGLWRGG